MHAQDTHGSRTRKLAGSQRLSPVYQLPLRGERDSSGKPGKLEQGEDCFLPLTMLAEYAQHVSIFVAAGEDQSESQRFSADSIELSSANLGRHQGIHECSIAQGRHFLCLNITKDKAQVCCHMQVASSMSCIQSAGSADCTGQLELFSPGVASPLGPFTI